MNEFNASIQADPKQVSGFVQIRVDYLRDENLSAAAKLVGAVYATYANRESGLAWPSLETIMKRTGLGRCSVKRARAELVKMGLLKIEQLKGKDAPRGRFGQVRYKLSPRIVVDRRSK